MRYDQSGDILPVILEMSKIPAYLSRILGSF